MYQFSINLGPKRNPDILSHIFYRWEFRLRPLVKVSSGSNQAISWAAFLGFRILFQVHSSWWKNSSACSCRTKVLFPAATWGALNSHSTVSSSCTALLEHDTWLLQSYQEKVPAPVWSCCLYNIMQLWEWLLITLDKFYWLEASHRHCTHTEAEISERHEHPFTVDPMIQARITECL